MDNNTQTNPTLPPTQPVNQLDPTIPVQPLTPQPIAPEPAQPVNSTPPVDQPTIITPPSESSGKSPLLYVGLVMFFLILGGATYYVLQPQNTAETTTAPQQVTYTTPEPTAIPTLSEEQELDTAVSYSLDESFAELEKDLQQL